MIAVITIIDVSLQSECVWLIQCEFTFKLWPLLSSNKDLETIISKGEKQTGVELCGEIYKYLFCWF